MDLKKYLNKSGHLVVGDGHKIYWEDWGNPKAETPIFFLHGGPGSGFKDKHKLAFDPNKQRVIFHDQRGAGRSTPFASTKNNTTQDLISDINKLRNHLKIGSIYLTGGSWGSALSLAYAIDNPNVVKKMLLSGIYLARKEDNDLIYYGVRQHYPDVNDRFMSLVPKAQQNDVIAYYDKQFSSSKLEIREKFVKEWVLYERSLMELDPNIDKFILDTDEEDKNALAVAKLETHYFLNDCFLAPNHILKNANKIAHISTVLVHGRYDFVCSPSGAFELNEALGDNSHLHVAMGGHRADPTLREIIKAYSFSFLG